MAPNTNLLSILYRSPKNAMFKMQEIAEMAGLSSAHFDSTDVLKNGADSSLHLNPDKLIHRSGNPPRRPMPRFKRDTVIDWLARYNARKAA